LIDFLIAGGCGETSWLPSFASYGICCFQRQRATVAILATFRAIASHFEFLSSWLP
jgi:hypothetical protein